MTHKSPNIGMVVTVRMTDNILTKILAKTHQCFRWVEAVDFCEAKNSAGTSILTHRIINPVIPNTIAECTFCIVVTGINHRHHLVELNRIRPVFYLLNKIIYTHGTSS